MRRIRYQVAMSLDGYIAGPRGEYDWIIMDPAIDFEGIFAQFDTMLMGRRTFEGMGSGGFGGDKEVLVVSRTLKQAEYPGVRIVSDELDGALRELRARPGRDIWLFGGGELFRSVLELGHVDGVEIAIIPVILGGGVAMVPAPARQTALALASHRVYPSGITLLNYEVRR